MDKGKSSTIGLVVSDVDKEVLVAEAQRRGLTVATLVRMLIKDFLSKRGGEQDKIIL